MYVNCLLVMISLLPLLFGTVGQCMNIEVRVNLQEFIQSPLLKKVGVYGAGFTEFLTLPADVKASQFGYEIVVRNK